MKIIFVGSSRWIDGESVVGRCRNLAAALTESGLYQAAVITLEELLRNDERAVAACEAADLLIFHRLMDERVIQVLPFWKARGKKIIIDLDHPLPSADFRGERMRRYTGWEIRDSAAEEKFRSGLRMADLITASSQRLADDCTVYARSVYLPDYLDLNRYLTPRMEHPGEVWVGLPCEDEASAFAFLPEMIAMLNEVGQLRPQVRFFVPHPGLSSEGFAGLEEPWFIPAAMTSLEEWPRLLSGLDVGLAPADGSSGTRIGRRRVLEYMAARVPWIASDVQPYHEFARYGWLVRNTPHEWRRAILEVVDHLEAYQEEAGGEAFLAALGQDVHENIHAIATIYASVI
uniref:Glycosyltransferase n=1 Tax=Anaerolinea thermolimosa TaxID=229919 RepID=A0A7C4PL68_9CHLR